MASEIRSILASAQAAEVKGDATEAARLLREAAAFYRDHKLITRAMQMLRHARRLEGHPDPGPALDAFSPRAPLAADDDYTGPTGEHDWSDEEDVFGFDFDAAAAVPDTGVQHRAPFERAVTLADP